MSKDDETQVATHDSVVSPLSDDPPALQPDTAPPPVDARRLIEAFRRLQQRIPDFCQLSVREERALMRVAYLDPQFIDAGIRAAGAWHQPKNVFGWTEEELHGEVDAIGDLDELEQELRVLLKGVAAVKLKRKHRLGQAILTIYQTLRITVNNADRTYLRPYLEEMKRAYLRRRKKKSGKTGAETDETKE